MLKNKNNLSIYGKLHLIWVCMENGDKSNKVRSALRFIEQCPLKIVKINVEAF